MQSRGPANSQHTDIRRREGVGHYWIVWTQNYIILLHNAYDSHQYWEKNQDGNFQTGRFDIQIKICVKIRENLTSKIIKTFKSLSFPVPKKAIAEAA